MEGPNADFSYSPQSPTTEKTSSKHSNLESFFQDSPQSPVNSQGDEDNDINMSNVEISSGEVNEPEEKSTSQNCEESIISSKHIRFSYD